MAELKYAGNILSDLVLPDASRERLAKYNEWATRILWLEDFIMEGAPSIILSWYWKATEEPTTPAHSHDYDEVLGFIGSDPQNPHELYGEVEMWLDDEQYFIDKSSLVLCPKGVNHCPLRVVRVDKPILFLAMSMSTKYYKLFNDAKK